MADAEGLAGCSVAVRMATGDAFTDEEIQRDLFDPIAEKIRRMRARDPELDPGSAAQAAADELARQKVGAALRAAIQDDNRVRAKAWRDRETTAMTDGGMRTDKVARSILQGTSGELYGSENSIDNYGGTRGRMLQAPLMTAVKSISGAMDAISDFWRMRGDPEVLKRVRQQVARLNGNDSIDVTDDEVANGVARAIQAQLEEARVQQNRAMGGEIIAKLKGYTGRLNHDPVLVAGGMWRELAALREAAAADPTSLLAKQTWTDLMKRVEANAARTWIAFTKKLALPETYDGVGWSDLTEDRTRQGRYAVSPEYTNEDDLVRTAQAKQDLLDLHARGIASSPDDLRELMLYRIWQRITGAKSVALGGAVDHLDFVPRVGNLADAVGRGKTLRFTPDGETAYSARYTKGTYYANVLKQLDRAGRNIALLERLGPNPEEGYHDMLDRLATISRQRGEANEIVKRLYSSATQAPFEVVSGVGNIPASLRTAAIGQDIRGWMSMVKLGSIGLSKVSDVPFSASVLQRLGAPFGQAYSLLGENARNMAVADRRLLGESLGAGAQTWVGRVAAGKIAGDGRPGTMARGTTATYRASLYTTFTDGIEHAVVGAASRMLGALADKGWDELPPDVRQGLARFGIGAEHWDIVRTGLEPLEEDGKTYLTLDHLDDRLDDDKVYEAQGLFHMLFHNSIADAINEPRAREATAARAPGSTFGIGGSVMRPGTPVSEFWMGMMQFKGFLTSALFRHMLPAALNARARPMMLANLIFGTMIAGYVSLQAKALSRGELPTTPQSLMEGNKPMSAPMAWAAVALSSLAQGGGLGMYGDFLFGELDRNGEPFDLSTLQGPVLSQGEQVAKVLGRLAKGDPGGASGAIKLAAQNIPIVNTWYTRAALDYLLTWRLQEAVNPGYLQRYQDRMQEKANSRYWLPPSSAAQ